MAELSAPVAEMVWQAYITQNPGFAQVMAKVFAPLGKGFNKAKKLYQTADTALLQFCSNGLEKLGIKKIPGTTNLTSKTFTERHIESIVYQVDAKGLEKLHYTKEFTYDMINNPGPLATGPKPPIENFAGGKYNIAILEEEMIFYRAGHSSKKTFGDWYSFHRPQSIPQVRIDKAIKPVWTDVHGGYEASSPIDGYFACKIPKGTVVHVGPVSSQGGIYVGGSDVSQIQIYLPRTTAGLEILNFIKFRM